MQLLLKRTNPKRKRADRLPQVLDFVMGSGCVCGLGVPGGAGEHRNKKKEKNRGSIE
jgi:hypothetical protein